MQGHESEEYQKIVVNPDFPLFLGNGIGAEALKWLPYRSIFLPIIMITATYHRLFIRTYNHDIQR
jgi:hypothetical protein